MACERTSDERIGEAVIKEVFQEQLKEVSLEEAVPLSLSETPEVKNEEEQKMVVQLATMVRIIGDKVKDDQQLKDAIDGLVASGKESNQRNYWQMVKLVFEDGQITWERIAVLFYVAGRMAVKMVEANLSPLVLDILKWTVDYFRSKLLNQQFLRAGSLSDGEDVIHDHKISKIPPHFSCGHCSGQFNHLDSRKKNLKHMLYAQP
ncbi:BCL2 associated X, apoptosis regulator b isoform X2 [Osmerus mordax]|uniref:BCL2 associated X, apoptosis regulator b isoform X2 n=1 Tax=Osmerus mordax TaxID=8014 RepID=UPI003510A397